MKKILLAAVNAKYIHSNPAVYSLRAYAENRLKKQVKENSENAAIKSGKATISGLKDKSAITETFTETFTESLTGEIVTIQIAEYTINQQSSILLEDIYKRKPDILAFSCYIWNWKMIRELLPEVVKLLPETAVWLGGPEVSFEAEKTMQEYPGLTGIMIGEGEETFWELAAYYQNGVPELKEINGIVYRENQEVHRNPVRQQLQMDELPFPYKSAESFRNRVIYYESSRGCPFRCSYCLSGIDKQVRFKSLSKVKQEILWFLKQNVPQVKFIDRTFNCNHEHALQIWKYIKEEDNGVTNFHFEIGGDLLTEEEIQLLCSMRPGLVQLEIGVQTTNSRTLDEICRKTDLIRLMENVKLLQESGNIHLHLDLIAGLPYEDLVSFTRSFNEVYYLRPEQLQLGFLKVLKGSYMKEKQCDYELKSIENPPYEVLSTKWLSYSSNCLLKRVEEMVELYYNSGQFSNTLPVLEKLFSTPFAMYESLAAYYEQKGYSLNSPSRIYRYTILLEFAQQVLEKEEANCSAKANNELFRELLTYDLYLRENCKSRPEFARSLQGEESLRKSFYESADRIARYLPAYAGIPARQIARMTHMEFFRYPVFQKSPEGKAEPETNNGFYCLLFDYQEKNPLTRNAKVVQIFFE